MVLTSKIGPVFIPCQISARSNEDRAPISSELDEESEMNVVKVKQIMTASPQCCAPQDTVATAARRMAAGNFGAVPVVDPQTHRLLGIITDRDITCRITAEGIDPNHTPVRAVMTANVATLGSEASVHECIRLMETRQVRRIPIIDVRGTVLGIVAQADLARATAQDHGLEHELAEMIEEVSASPRVLAVE